MNAFDYLRKNMERIKEDGRTVTISLMLTEKCNFQCAHCFYGCGPDMPAKYMSPEVLRKVRQLVLSLNDWNINVNVNLIGGEPTVNMGLFAAIFREVSGWIDYPRVCLEMTTNGWWLEHPSAAKKFFETVSHTANAYPGSEEGFSIRISQDIYHAEFRRNGLNPKYALDEIFEYGGIDGEPVLYETDYICSKCGYEFKTKNPRRCPKCHGEDFDSEYTEGIYIEKPKGDMGWIYVDDDKNRGASLVVPSGVRGQFGQNVHKCKWQSSFAGDKLTFFPDGSLGDCCCKGSHMPWGSVDDNPIVLLALAYAFTCENAPTCNTCRYDAQDWHNRAMNMKSVLEKTLHVYCDHFVDIMKDEDN